MLKNKLLPNIIEKLPNVLLKYLLPPQFILYGHIINDNNHIVKNRFKYPSFNELSEFVELFRKMHYEFVSYRDYLENNSQKKILLTFDDGYKEIYTELHPYMLEKHIPYMIFILTEPLEKSNFIVDILKKYKKNNQRYYLNKDEILKLKSDGVDIGFHTRIHFKIDDYTKINDKILLEEVKINRKYKNLFSEPLAFAYPFRAPEGYLKYDSVLKKIGFKNIFDTKGLKNNRNYHFFRLSMDVDKAVNCRNCILYNIKRSVASSLIKKLKNRF